MNVKAQVGETFTITTSPIPGMGEDSCYLELVFTITNVADVISCQLDVYANKTGTVYTMRYTNLGIRDNGGNLYSGGTFTVPRTTTRQQVSRVFNLHFSLGPNSLTINYDGGYPNGLVNYTDYGYVGLYKSLRFNNSQVVKLYFNGTQVKNVYLNGTKIDSY